MRASSTCAAALAQLPLPLRASQKRARGAAPCGVATAGGASTAALFAPAAPARAHWRVPAASRRQSRTLRSASADDTWFRKPKQTPRKMTASAEAEPSNPPPDVFDGLHVSAVPTVAAWGAWGDALRAACAAGAPDTRAELLRAAVADVLRRCGDECASVAVTVPRKRTTSDGVAHVWVLPSRRAHAALGTALLSLVLEAPAGCAASRTAADAEVERHVRARAAALTQAARGNAKAAQKAAFAAHVYNGYDEEECHRARAQQLCFLLAAWQPAFGAVVAADGATVRFCRFDGAAADPDAPPRWTPPLPLSYAGGSSEEERLKRTGRGVPPEGFCRLFQMLYAEPAALGQRLRVPGLIARLLADTQPGGDAGSGGADDVVAGQLRSLAAHELRNDARQLRDAAWLLGHGERVRAYLLPASLRRRYFPEERGAAVALVPADALGLSARIWLGVPARLADKAPALARRSDAPRMLHACRDTSGQVFRPCEGLCFAVFAPAGMPLATLGAQPAWAVRLVSVDARRQLAEAVASSLLQLLRVAHCEAQVAHLSVLPEHCMLLPPADDDAACAAAEDVQELGAALLAAAPQALRCALLSWRATKLGSPAAVAWQYGYGPDALEELSYNHEGSGVRFVSACAAWDCECVAYIYAAIVHGAAVLGGDYAPPPWAVERVASDGPAELDWLARQAARHEVPVELPWTYWAASRAAEQEREAHNDAVRARGGTDAQLLGRLAWRRAAWLREHPQVLGERGARFWEHARAGRAVYSLHISDEEHAALLAAPPPPGAV